MRSTHYGDLKNWVIKVINSCENLNQLHSAHRLINLYDKNLIRDKKVDDYIRTRCYLELYTVYENKVSEIMDKREKELLNG
jgi:hypothetical protein